MRKDCASMSIAIVLCCVALLLSACNTSTQLWQADKLVKDGRYQDAHAAYLLVIQKNPGSTSAREATLRLGRLYEERLTRPEDAMHIYVDLARRYSGTPEAQEALWRLGMYYYNQAEYQRALPKFVQIIMDSSDSDTTRIEEAHLQRAACFVGLGRYRDALEVYENFAQQYADSDLLPDAQLHQADLYLSHLERRDLAVALLRSLAELHPETPEGLAAQTRLEELQAMAVPAAPVDEGGLRDIGPPTRPDAQRLLNSWGPSETFGVSVKELILGGQGVFGGEELQESLAGDGALLDDAVYNLGLMLAMTGEYHKAGACLERSLELGLDEPNLYQQLGICYREVGAKQHARRAFRELHQRDPRSIGRMVEAADRHLSEGHHDVARRHYESLQGITIEHDALIEQRLAQIR